ncbi:MAG TPA: DUF5107 domain-containing protein [Chloroflexota bacterium]|nr:DUF5107 domain-containing protein [Chloroflexota bacterium]
MTDGQAQPDAPSTVRIWEEEIVFPTYASLPPDRHPMFLERRVYQGSSGAVYPLPLIDRISGERVERTYRGVYLENEYIRVLVLPELGGRIHSALDKTNNYDFVYHNHVIKPALVGLAGPWISGGIEFNWPQHHRPTTFMPVDYSLQAHDDGSKTVWVGEIEPMNRMKGMIGITLRPGRSCIEASIQLYNRTPLPQSFLWWANLAVPVNEHYQSLFPSDIDYVADHAKRAVSDFPIAHGTYYGIDYAPGTDITWWKNIPVPSSYMALHSSYDYLAGYDHGKEAGIIHVADHHLSPGKKMWTWGAGEFGRRWYEQLTDDDGPYIELMTGVYSANQPDFSWLQPYETKTFSQYWYPLRRIGGVKNATTDGAVTVDQRDGRVFVGANATAAHANATLTVTDQERVLWRQQLDIAPDRPFRRELADLPIAPDALLGVTLTASDGRELVRYQQATRLRQPRPRPATPAPPPHAVPTVEQLYLLGLHLEQYHHATRDPDPYYQEALARDPGDVRANTALGLLLLRRGVFEAAAAHFERAIATITLKNPNPYDGEPYYHLGVALRFLARDEDAYEAFYKASWNGAWHGAASYALAELACRSKYLTQAAAHARRSLEHGYRNTKARNLLTCLRRVGGQLLEAEQLARETVAIDALDFWSQRELAELAARQGRGEEANARRATLQRLMRGHAPSYLDLAGDYAGAGLWAEAIAVLIEWVERRGDQTDPLVFYYLGYYTARLGDHHGALSYYRRAARESSDYCFPNRLDAIIVLRHARQLNPDDARAPYYLGNLFYDKKRHGEAIQQWEWARALDDTFSIVHRNLGLAYFNIERNPDKALASYQRAFDANPTEPRLLYERDQLAKRLNLAPAERLARLEGLSDLVEQRDDLYLERVTLCNQMGRYDEAISLLGRRQFRPWEGGEGMAIEQHVQAHLLRGRQVLHAGCPDEALRYFEAARIYPSNLGEARHEVFTSEARVFYYRGLVYDALGDRPAAVAAYERAAADATHNAALPYYRGLASRKLGREEEAVRQFTSLLVMADVKSTSGGAIDFFATSLPTFLIFEDDLELRNRVETHYLRGLGFAGLERAKEAQAEFEAAVTLDINHLDAQTHLESLTELG